MNFINLVAMLRQLIIFIVLLSGSCYSQILDNTKGYAFTDRPFFNETFIRNNKIKKMTGKYTLKKPGDVMRPTEYKYVFTFDSLGHLISTYETKNDNGFKDTVINLYQYGSNHLLKVHWKNDTHGYTSKHYEYDSLNRIIAEETRRDIFDKEGKITQSIILNRETMRYDDSKHQVKKTIYNSYNLPYLEVFHNYNEDGYLLNREERFKMTSNSVHYLYEYNKKGLIASIKTTSEIEGKFEEEWFFKYDEFGNLYEKTTFKDGKQTTDLQIIYNDQTKLLSSVLTRDVATNFIYILRFQDIEYWK